MVILTFFDCNTAWAAMAMVALESAIPTENGSLNPAMFRQAVGATHNSVIYYFCHRRTQTGTDSGSVDVSARLWPIRRSTFVIGFQARLEKRHYACGCRSRTAIADPGAIHIHHRHQSLAGSCDEYLLGL